MASRARRPPDGDAPRVPPAPPDVAGERWTPVWIVLAVATFIWASGCLRRKVNPPVPVTSGASGDVTGAVRGDGTTGPARVPRLAQPWPQSEVGTNPAAAPEAQPDPVPVLAPRGEPLRGLPEPLGNPQGPGPEPLWRQRARNY